MHVRSASAALVALCVSLAAPLVRAETAPTARAEVAEAKAEQAAPAPAEAPKSAAAADAITPSAAQAAEVITDRIRRGETLGGALARHGVSMLEVHHLVQALKGKLDVRQIRPGDVFVLEQHGDAPAFRMDVFEFRKRAQSGAPTVVRAESQGTAAAPSYNAFRRETPIVRRVGTLTGTIQSSLYNAMVGKGEGPTLVNRFADVFGWEIDFYRQAQKGDAFKVIYEKFYADGRFVGYGRVLAAEYVNYGDVHRGFWFASKDGEVTGLYDERGDSLERSFLKSPLALTYITSSYGQRFHPVLKRMRKHNGIDYGASIGTPFFAVADGTVVEARYSRSAGNMVRLRHANGYKTEYFHASRIAKGIKPGVRVKQRQVIGYVGNTGRSTGPHLHYGMFRHDAYVNPAKQKFPAGKSIPEKHLETYLRDVVTPLLAELAALEIG